MHEVDIFVQALKAGIESGWDFRPNIETRQTILTAHPTFLSSKSVSIHTSPACAHMAPTWPQAGLVHSDGLQVYERLEDMSTVLRPMYIKHVFDCVVTKSPSMIYGRLMQEFCLISSSFLPLCHASLMSSPYATCVPRCHRFSKAGAATGGPVPSQSTRTACESALEQSRSQRRRKQAREERRR